MEKKENKLLTILKYVIFVLSSIIVALFFAYLIIAFVVFVVCKEANIAFDWKVPYWILRTSITYYIPS